MLQGQPLACGGIEVLDAQVHAGTDRRVGVQPSFVSLLVSVCVRHRAG